MLDNLVTFFSLFFSSTFNDKDETIQIIYVINIINFTQYLKPDQSFCKSSAILNFCFQVYK